LDAAPRPALWKPSLSLLAVMFALGFVIGPALDQIHVLTHTLSYPRQDFLRQSWWVFPQFGIAAIAMTLPFWMLRPVFGDREVEPVAIAEVAWTLIRFVTMYLLSGLLHDHEWLLVAWFLIAFGLTVARRREGAPVHVHALTCAIGGTAWEATISGLGHFHYDVPSSLFGVPAWLPFLYLHAAYWLRPVARYIPPPKSA